MKYFLFLTLLVIIVGLWRQRQRLGPLQTRRAISPTQNMVVCAVCQLHIPRAEAFAGQPGYFYCSQAHQHQA